MTLEYNPVIENVIEITKAYEWLYHDKKYGDYFASDYGISMTHPYTELNRSIVDWANEFEMRIGPAYDWESSEYDYLSLIEDFAVKKIMELVNIPKDLWPKQNTDVDFDNRRLRRCDMSEKYNSVQDIIKELWLEFGDVPLNPNTECIEEDWRVFPAGTHREDVWHWFEEAFGIPVSKLMYEFEEV